jgi:hypothetical protein
MSPWDAVGAVAQAVSAAGIGILAFQVTEARRARGVSEVAAYNDTKAHMDARAPRVEVHVLGAVWPPLGGSDGTPQPYPGSVEWHFPQGTSQLLLLQAVVMVVNRGEGTVKISCEGDLWELAAVDGRPRRMPPETLLPPEKSITAYLRGGLSVKEWSEIDSRVRAGDDVPPAVTATITAHDDADEGVIDTWNLWLTGTPIAEDPARGSVWRLTPPPPLGGENGAWCQQYESQPLRRRVYWLSRSAGRELKAPEPHRRPTGFS